MWLVYYFGTKNKRVLSVEDYAGVIFQDFNRLGDADRARQIDAGRKKSYVIR